MIHSALTFAPSAALSGRRAERTLAFILALSSLFLLAVGIIPGAGAF